MADVVEFPKMGVKVKVITEFVSALGRESLAGLTTTEVCEMYVKPATLGKGSMCELIKAENPDSDDVGAASVFISHAWRYNFLDVLDSLERNFELEPDAILWFDLFSNDQNKAPDLDFYWWSSTFKSAIQDFGRVVMVLSPWSTPIPFTRGWCLYEVYCAVVTGAKFEVALSQKERSEMMQNLCTHSTLFVRLMLMINVEKSECYNKDDLAKILDVVKTEVPGGFSAINNIVRGKLRDWLCETLESNAESFKHTNILKCADLLYAAGDFRRQMDDATGALRNFESIMALDKAELLAAAPGPDMASWQSGSYVRGGAFRQIAWLYVNMVYV